MEFYYACSKWIIRLYQTIFHQDCRVIGSTQLPAGPKILVGNHPNATDGFYLPFIFREKLFFLMQGDIFSTPVLGWLMAKAGQIPVYPERKWMALKKTLQLLAQGKTVVIFPEGRLNPDKQPVKVGNGVVRMSLVSNAPIVPVGFYVPESHLYNVVLPKEGRLAKGRIQTGGTCFIKFGVPWRPSAEIQGKPQESALEALTTLMMEKIDALVRQARMECLREKLERQILSLR